MHVVARGRQFLARHPSAYWFAVAVCGALAAWTIHQRLAAIDDERAAWGTARTVLVATAPLAPGDELDSVRPVEVPDAVAPPRAVSELPDGARLYQRVGAGEIIVDDDLTTAPGPAGRARAGTVVVGVAAPEGGADGAGIGLSVRIVADGIVLADGATIVDRIGSRVFVAVPAADGPAVAAAEQAGIASMIYVPS